MELFLAKRRKLVRQTGSVCFLDFLRHLEGESADGLDVPCDAVPSKWDGCVIPHKIVLEYGHGTDTGSDVNQRHSVFHLLGAKDRLGRYSWNEEFARYSDLHTSEELVKVRGQSFASDEYLEFAFDLLRAHPDDLVFRLVYAIFSGERLCDSPIDDLSLLILQRIGLQRL